MASNPMQKKARNSFLLGMLLMLIIAAIVMVGLIMFLKRDNTNKQQQQQQTGGKEVYVLNQDVLSGQAITEDMLKLSVVNTDAIPSDAYGKSDLGLLSKEIVNDNGEYMSVSKYKSKLNLSAGTVICENMFYEGSQLQASERIQEYNMLQLPIQLDIGEYVDIRIFLSNGQDYIVIPHKEVIDISDTTIWLKLTEEEILLMGNAIVESYMSPATNLYVTKYVEPGMQTAATVTYIPSLEVITLINKDPNVIDSARRELISRYNSNQDLRTNIANELNKYSQEGLTNIEAQILEAREKAIEERSKYLNGAN